MTTRRRSPQGQEMPCGQKGCYRPESSRNLTWCMYANYWRYSCLKPEGVDVIPTPAVPVGVFFYSSGILSLTDSSRTPFLANLSRHSTDSSSVSAKYLSFQTTT